MQYPTVFFIALALSMDAFAVSIASGVIIKKQRIYHALRFAFSFGLFQMFMPVLGWMGGSKFRHLISSIDHWVAFGLLSIIGGKMIYEALKMESYENVYGKITIYVLLGLSVATSIDALAVGLSFAFLDVSILAPVVIIGVITFFMSFMGFIIGNKFGHIFEKKIEILGGVILIAIGLKILFEHLIGS